MKWIHLFRHLSSADNIPDIGQALRHGLKMRQNHRLQKGKRESLNIDDVLEAMGLKQSPDCVLFLAQKFPFVTSQCMQ